MFLREIDYNYMCEKFRIPIHLRGVKEVNTLRGSKWVPQKEDF